MERLRAIRPGGRAPPPADRPPGGSFDRGWLSLLRDVRGTGVVLGTQWFRAAWLRGTGRQSPRQCECEPRAGDWAALATWRKLTPPPLPHQDAARAWRSGR